MEGQQRPVSGTEQKHTMKNYLQMNHIDRKAVQDKAFMKKVHAEYAAQDGDATREEETVEMPVPSID